MPPVEESAPDYEGNARLKAHALIERVSPDVWVLADDSGLEVEALEGRPGVHSARFAGPDATDAANNALLLSELAGIPPEGRRAKFVCCCVLLGQGVDEVFTGECSGRIIDKPIGLQGFGYDPLFVPDDHMAPFAVLGEGVKSEISHRSRAVKALADWISG